MPPASIPAIFEVGYSSHSEVIVGVHFDLKEVEAQEIRNILTSFAWFKYHNCITVPKSLANCIISAKKENSLRLASRSFIVARL